MKRFMVPAMAAAAISFGVSAGNAAECVNGFLDLKNNDEYSVHRRAGLIAALISPDYSAAPSGAVVEECRPGHHRVGRARSHRRRGALADDGKGADQPRGLPAGRILADAGARRSRYRHDPDGVPGVVTDPASLSSSRSSGPAQAGPFCIGLADAVSDPTESPHEEFVMEKQQLTRHEPRNERRAGPRFCARGGDDASPVRSEQRRARRSRARRSSMKILALTAAAATILAFASAAQAAPYANCYLHVAGNPNIPCPPVHTVMVTPTMHYRHVPAHVVVHERAPVTTGSIALHQPHFAPARQPHHRHGGTPVGMPSGRVLRHERARRVRGHHDPDEVPRLKAREKGWPGDSGPSCRATASRGCRRNGRRSPPPPPWPARRGACGPCSPAGPRNCGSRWRRSARPAASLSAFMARHIEQPGSRHSKPAALKIRSSPSASACSFTRPEPGTTMALTLRVDVLALDDLRGGAQILDAAVGAGADEDAVERDVVDPRAGREAHIGERPPLRRRASSRPRWRSGSGTDAGDGDDVLRAGAPGDDRRQLARRRAAPRGRNARPRRSAASPNRRAPCPRPRPSARSGGP